MCLCVLLAPWGISFQWNVSLFSPFVAGGDAEWSFGEICDVSCSVKILSIRQTSGHSGRVTQPLLLDSIRVSTVPQMIILNNRLHWFLLGGSVIVLETTGSTGLYHGSVQGIGFTGFYQVSVVIQELLYRTVLLVSSVFLSFHTELV